MRPASANRLLPAGPPRRRSSRCSARCASSFRSRRAAVTAIGYHGVGGGALALEPVGAQANEGLLPAARAQGRRRRRRGLVVLPARRGPARARRRSTSARRPGPTSTRRWTGRSSGSRRLRPQRPTYGARIDIQPTSAPSLVVSRLAPAPRPGADGRRDRGRRELEARQVHRPLRRRAAGARALHERRGQPRRRSKSTRRATLTRLLRILFVADVFGAPGRGRSRSGSAACARSSDVDFCVVNGENAADGAGSRRRSPSGCSPRAPT